MILILTIVGKETIIVYDLLEGIEKESMELREEEL